jgi:hypothetical protein
VSLASVFASAHRLLMLDAFIVANRDAIIAGARVRVASRMSPKPTHVELTNGIPVFLGIKRIERISVADFVEDVEVVSSRWIYRECLPNSKRRRARTPARQWPCE